MTTIPAPGFAAPTHDAQQVFRRVLDAMAHPGNAYPVDGPAAAPDALGPALAGVLLMLLDEQATVHLGVEDAEARDYLAFHTGAPFAPAEEAAFVVARAGELPELGALQQGTDEAPHVSATVLVDARERFAGTATQAWTGTGPGVRDTVRIEADWAPADFLDQWREVGERFPRGIDIVVVRDHEVYALPRTCRLVPAEPTPAKEA